MGDVRPFKEFSFLIAFKATSMESRSEVIQWLKERGAVHALLHPLRRPVMRGMLVKGASQDSKKAGSWTMKRVPTAPLLSMEMRPPCASTISLTIERPRPAAPGSCPGVRYCAKRSKT